MRIPIIRKKRVLTVFLGLTLAFGSVFTATGQAAAKDTERLTPVVLIHGVGASTLRHKKENGKYSLGKGYPSDLLKGGAGDPENLEFDSTGNPRTDTVSIDMTAIGFFKVPLQKDITDLADYLSENEYELNSSLFEFFYDFRYSVPHNSKILADLIETIKREQGVEKVDLIGHSMGGLVAKSYLNDSANAPNVRRLIFVASPHLGAPKALKVLRYGDDLDAPIFNECKLKRVGRNMPGLYNLFPGKKYFDVKGGYFYDDDDLDGDNDRGLLDYEKTINNMKKGKETRCPLVEKVDVASYDENMPLYNLNNKLIDEDVIDFHRNLDDWAKPETVEVFNVVGYGQPTIESIRERGSEVTLNMTTEGDGTVPLWSAESVASDYVYYVNLPEFKKATHSTMIGEKEIVKQIHRLLKEGNGLYIGNVQVERPGSGEFRLSSAVMKK